MEEQTGSETSQTQASASDGRGSAIAEAAARYFGDSTPAEGRTDTTAQQSSQAGEPAKTSQATKVEGEVGKAADVSAQKPGEAAKTLPAEEKKETESTEDAAITERLLRLEAASRKAAAVRRQKAAEETARKAKEEEEKALQNTHKADLDMAKRIREARASGKRLELLRAIGLTDAELQDGFALELLNELEATEKPPVASKADIEAMIEARVTAELARRKEAEDGEKAKKEGERAKEAELEAAEIIDEIKIHYEAGQYPLLRAEQDLTPRQLLDFKARYEKHNPQIHLRGKGLLDAAEAYLRSRYEEAKKRMAAIDRILSPPAQGRDVSQASSSGTGSPPTAKTSQSTVSSIIPPAKTGGDQETYDEAHERSRQEFIARFSSR